MAPSREQLVSMFRQAGMDEIADEAQQTLPDPVEEADIVRFCNAHGISASSLTDLMGGSP
jgi:hypothetical protein